MKRKILLLILSIALCAFVFAACPKKNDSQSGTNSQSETSSSTSELEQAYSLSFDEMGGNPVSDIRFDTGDEVTLPVAEYGDYVFMGWYTDSDTWTNKIESGTVNFSANTTVFARWGITVCYNTDGGTDIDSVTVDVGSTLDTLPIAIKQGYLMTGWFTDENGENRFDSTAELRSSLTLYARYSANVSNVIAKMQYLDDIQTENPSIEVTSSIPLNEENIGNYLTVKTNDGSAIALCVSDGETEFSITPLTEFISGITYIISLSTTALQVKSVGEQQVEADCTKVAFNIYRENYENITERTRKHICFEQIFDSEENIYTMTTSDPDNGKAVSAIYVLAEAGKSFSANDIVSIGDNETESDEDYYYKIVDAEFRSLSEGDVTVEYWYLEFISPELEDIYSSFDAYKSSEVDLAEYMSLSAELIGESIGDSEGMKAITASMRYAVGNSDTIKSLADTLSADDKAELDSGIENMSFAAPQVSVNINGTSVGFSISFEYEIPIKDICTINISISIADEFSLTYSYFTKCVEHYTWGIFDKYMVSVNAQMRNNFAMSFGATIEFSGTGGDKDKLGDTGGDGKVDKIDIFDEVKSLLGDVGENVNKISETISGSPLFESEDDDDLEYVDIIDVPIGEIPIPVTNIITFSIGLDAVVSVGAKAGLFVDMSQEYIEQIVISNGRVNADGSVTFYDGFEVYQNQLKSDFNIKVTLKGKIGLRCGLEAKLKVSVAHLNALAAFYVSATVGPYVELVGIAQFSYSYDAITKTSVSEIYGGMFLEAGLFIDIKAGIDTLIFDSETSLWSYKYKLFTVGSTRCPVRFNVTEAENSAKMVWERDFKLTPNWCYYNIDYIDLRTGEIVTNKIGSWLTYKFKLVENYGGASLVTVSTDGRISINSKFKGTQLFFKLIITAEDSGAIVGKTIERTLLLCYEDRNAESYASTKNHLFVDYRKTISGIQRTIINGGNNHIYIGFPVVSPIVSENDFPVRDGYYLDLNDLWLKYINGNTYDASWDGTFGECSIDDPAYTEYRLNWKPIELVANYYVSELDENGNRIAWTNVYTCDSVRFYWSGTGFMVPYYADAPEVYGLNFNGFTISNYSTFNVKYNESFLYDFPAGTYRVLQREGYTADELYKDYLINGLNFYGTYSEQTYTVTWHNRTNYLYEKQVYRVLDYAEDEEIALSAPSNFQMNKEIYGKQINYYTIDDVKYTSLEGVVVDKNLTVYAVSTKGYYTLTIGNADISSVRYTAYHLAEGDAMPTLNEAALREIIDSSVLNTSSLYAESYTIDMEAFSADMPEVMPSNNLTVNLKISYTYKLLNVVFDAGEHEFADGTENVTESDGKYSVTFSGYYTYQNVYDGNLSYVVPALKTTQYYATGEDGSLYKYDFLYWYQQNTDNCLSVGYNYYFRNSGTFIPIYSKQEVIFNAYLLSESYGGIPFTYNILKGGFYGKTLAEVLADMNVSDPQKFDYTGKYSYSFINWGVDAESYVFGVEKDVNGICKKDLYFNAKFESELIDYIITFDANGGTFDGGVTQIASSGNLGDTIDIFSYVPERDSDGDSNYVFIGWSDVQNSGYILGNMDMTYTVKAQDRTFYAVYNTNPLQRNITINGGGADGLTGYVDYSEANLGGNSQTSYSETSYDGRTLYVYAAIIGIYSQTKTYSPDYIKAGEGENAVVAYFNEYGIASFIVDGDMNFTVYYKAAEEKIYNAVFYAQGSALKPGEEEPYFCNGYFIGYRSMQRFEVAYGSKIVAPQVNFYSSEGYKFVGWKRLLYNSDGSPLLDASGNETFATYAPGEEITVTGYWAIDAVYEFDETQTYDVTIYADMYYTDYYDFYTVDELYGIAKFPDGSTVLRLNGVIDSEIVCDMTPSLAGFEFIGWQDDDGNSVDSLGTYTKDKQFYASYRRVDGVAVTINSGEGLFDNGDSEMSLTVNLGTLTTSLATPIANSNGLAFSYYEDADGNVVNSIEGECELYAVYAIPIYTFEDLMKVSALPNENYVLMNTLGSLDDVELDDNYFPSTPNYVFSPVCADTANGFGGLFNGNGKSIFAIYSSKNDVYAGIFAKVSGKVMNLTSSLIVIITTENGKTSCCKAAGCVAGVVTETGIIENCYVMGSVNLQAKVLPEFACGMIVGQNYGTVSKIYYNANPILENTVECDGKCYYGGAIGYNVGLANQLRFKSYMFEVSVANSAKLYMGMVAGYNSGSLTNCISISGDVKVVLTNGDNRYEASSFKIGAIAGGNDGVIESCAYEWNFLFEVEKATLYNPETEEYVLMDKIDYTTYDGIYFGCIIDWESGMYDFYVMIEGEKEYCIYYNIEEYSDKAKLLAYLNAFVIADGVANGGTVNSCFDMGSDTANSDESQMYSITGISDACYGYGRYLKINAVGLNMAS